MNSTSHSLLNRLKEPRGDNEASWNRFIELYTPLLHHWATRLSVPFDERHDLVQNTLVKLLVSISSYHRDRPGNFRGWLLAVLRNTWIDSQRRRHPIVAGDPETLALQGPDPLELSIDREYRQYVLSRIQALVLVDFPETTQLAFRRYVLENRPAVEVAEELGLTVNAVYLIRTRIVRRIREELAGLID